MTFWRKHNPGEVCDEQTKQSGYLTQRLGHMRKPKGSFKSPPLSPEYGCEGAAPVPNTQILKIYLSQQWRKAPSSPYAWQVLMTRPHWPSGSGACRRPTQPWPRSPWSSAWQGPPASSWRPPQGWRSRLHLHPRARKRKTISSTARAEPQPPQGHKLWTGVKV